MVRGRWNEDACQALNTMNTCITSNTLVIPDAHLGVEWSLAVGLLCTFGGSPFPEPEGLLIWA